ncbi:5-deoxyglucuronate isomerase [Paenibacillus cellulosilyticus]|uniref:5-deoxy-glucuronate isomerase n=1 Tax=Paenibacillus cellulosilyticus TaxID=375489 RepID=A0A2V2YMI1_9BACL|nr:5-deoxy-glucuronate isomerase [Paenibacillus cellulosilyticus]PWV94426.1 5-deoxyglucuronate isomerase [Paenibacillus cellulosilyticus]QKS43917.1 5-deoxy-glucuronate isomerase [Paenibacillus cellulosilyticus]
MANLIVPASAKPDQDGRVLAITPESAGWEYVGFEVFRLAAGETLQRETGEQEACLVLLSGKADVSTNEEQWNEIGSRMSVFEKIPPYSVYVPSGDAYNVTALTDLELAICLAPGQAGHPARLIAPQNVGVENRGSGNMARLVHNILPESQPADSLLVVEVFTPGGHWSSYPPHKHDRDDLPQESLLEETYYYHIQPEQGFAIQRVYTDDRSLDETLAVRDGQAVLVPEGYHPVSAPPGYEVYYLNVMAGPKRTWKFHNDPDHDWLMPR